MKTVIVEARPSDATGQPVDIRLAGGGRGHYLFQDRSDWRAGVISLPRIQSSLGFGKDGFTGGAVAQASAIGFSPAMASTRALVAGLIWNDAAITVSVADDEAADPSFRVRLAGTVAGYSISAGRFVFTLSDMAGRLGEPLLKDTFAGTGGIEGDAAAKGRIKRRSWGRCWNVEGRVLLAAWNIYEFGDPARQLGAFDAVKDKGRPVTIVTVAWAGSIAATLDALKAVQVPEGGCAAAPSIACVKFWTQPSTLTADLRGELGTGYVEHVPGIAAAISAAAEGPGLDGLAALAALRPDPAGLHADDASETPAQMLDRLTLRASLSWGVTADRRMALRPIAFADPVETVAFEDVERRAAYAPVAGVKVGFQKNHRVHTDAEISAAVLAGDVVYPDGTGVVEAIAQAGKTAEWDQVADPNGNKPEDKATNSALPGSLIGPNRTAAEVVGTLDVNVEAILAQTLRQDDFAQIFDARTLVEGQSVGTKFLAFRTQASDPVTGFASAADFSGLFVKSKDGTGWTMKLDAVKAGNAKLSDVFAGIDTSLGRLGADVDDLGLVTGTLSRSLSEVGAKVGGTEAKVTQLMEAFASDNEGVAGFALAASVSVSGKKYITGISGVAGTRGNELNFVSENFNFVRANGGNPLRLLTYNGTLNRWEFSADVYARRVVADSIQAGDIKSAAVTKTRFAILDADVSVSRGATSTVVSIDIVKDDATSVLKVQFFGMFWSPDDLQFAGSFVVDGATAYTGGSVNIILDNKDSQGRMPMTPFSYLTSIPAGPHTITFQVTNTETDPVDLTIKAGSAIEVIELKKAAL